LLIAGAFWFAGDLHAGGNAYRWRIFQFVRDKKLPLMHLVYAPGITFYPWQTCNRCAGIKFKKIQTIQKKFKIF
jgi:hypothetical protein